MDPRTNNDINKTSQGSLEFTRSKTGKQAFISTLLAVLAVVMMLGFVVSLFQNGLSAASELLAAGFIMTSIASLHSSSIKN